MPYFRVKEQDDLFGLVDDHDNYLVNPIFEKISYENKLGLYYAYKNNRLFRIREHYDETISFYDEKDSLKYLMKNGKVIEYPIRIANDFGLYKVDGLYGLVNTSFDVILPPIFEGGHEFSGGFEQYFIKFDTTSRISTYNEERKSIYFIKSETYFTKEILDDLLGIYSGSPFDEYWYFDQNLMLMVVPDLYNVTINKGTRRYFSKNKYGLISEESQIITDSIFDELVPDSSNNYKYRIGEKYGFIDGKGNKIRKNTSDRDAFQFQRVCNSCGKVWYTYINEERKLKTSLGEAFISGVFSSFSEASYIRHTIDEELNNRELTKLQSCPVCGSRSYTEDIF